MWSIELSFCFLFSLGRAEQSRAGPDISWGLVVVLLGLNNLISSKNLINWPQRSPSQQECNDDNSSVYALKKRLRIGRVPARRDIAKMLDLQVTTRIESTVLVVMAMVASVVLIWLFPCSSSGIQNLIADSRSLLFNHQQCLQTWFCWSRLSSAALAITRSFSLPLSLIFFLQLVCFMKKWLV